jgi:hypothetical protein
VTWSAANAAAWSAANATEEKEQRKLFLAIFKDI